MTNGKKDNPSTLSKSMGLTTLRLSITGRRSITWTTYRSFRLTNSDVQLNRTRGKEKHGEQKVEFDAHKTVKKETEVEFTKRDGTPVDFTAKKPVKVPVHVKFTAKDKKKK
jgi:hypothetical protein